MEKSEPTLVPEWLKKSGSSTGGSSVPHSDDRATSRITRNKSFVNSNGHDFGRSSSDMTTTSYFRKSSSSNGSGHLRPYSSFGRNQRDKEWEKDTYDSRGKGRVVLGNRRHGEYSEPLGSNFSSIFQRDGLRRSQSMINGERADTWQKKTVTELSSASGNNSNGLHIRSNPEVKKNTFERDFPSLGADEKAFVPEVGRIPSPGLNSAIQSLPIGTSVAIGCEKWTSALAEVPILVGSNGTSFSSVQIAAPSSSTSVVSDITTGLNMAKTVAQGSSRAQTIPQMSVGTQRLEELAIKQSRQLIPVTPVSKTLVVNTSDKQKTNLGQHHPPVCSLIPVTHSPRGGLTNGDVPKTLNAGKLHVLKPMRDKNGVTPVLKDTSSPTNGSEVVSSTVTAAGLVSGSALTRGPPNKPAERNPVFTALEKRPTSQARSRNDFFNQVRKKSMSNSSFVSDSVAENSSCYADKLTDMEAVLALNTPQASETPLSESPNGNLLSEGSDDMTCNGDDSHAQINTQSDSINEKFTEEEEAAFLHSLGWEENADDDGLTEEEIKEFYRDATKYISSKPSLKALEGKRSVILSPLDLKIEETAGGSPGLSLSDAKLES